MAICIAAFDRALRLLHVVRGSSSRRAPAPCCELADVLSEAGSDVVITPDGPRGPAYELGPGIIFLAQKSGRAVLPINLEYSSCWRVKSWDRFILPRPFSQGARDFRLRSHQVRDSHTDEEFEAERLRLQDAMMSLVEER